MFAVERTANIKGNLHMHKAAKMLGKTIARRACGFNFPASQQKVKKKFLSDLCVLSDLSRRSSKSEVGSGR
jgi:hypothetical protein